MSHENMMQEKSFFFVKNTSFSYGVARAKVSLLLFVALMIMKGVLLMERNFSFPQKVKNHFSNKIC